MRKRGKEPGPSPARLAGGRRTLYLDCFSGISGDMFLGLSVDLGVPLATLKRSLASLRLGGYRLSSRRVIRGGLAGTQVQVRIPGAPAEDPGLHVHSGH